MTLILVHTAHPQAVKHAGDGFGVVYIARAVCETLDQTIRAIAE